MMTIARTQWSMIVNSNVPSSTYCDRVYTYRINRKSVIRIGSQSVSVIRTPLNHNPSRWVPAPIYISPIIFSMCVWWCISLILLQNFSFRFTQSHCSWSGFATYLLYSSSPFIHWLVTHWQLPFPRIIEENRTIHSNGRATLGMRSSVYYIYHYWNTNVIDLWSDLAPSITSARWIEDHRRRRRN